MSYPFFNGRGQKREGGVTLPVSRRAEFLKPEHYRADQGLIDAVNVSLLLGQPLLLTGEPGTGKTQLAYYLAWELDLGLPLKYETKSTSTADSIFYSYDALKRFQHAQSGIKRETAHPYITYNALGTAILFSHKKEDVAAYLTPDMDHPGQRRSVVLIDEIDKAPRDFPNDILNEIDQMYFRVDELDNQRIEAHSAFRPIVLMTSNSEKDLPAAFLRRCVFYNIPFPPQDRLKDIVSNRLGLFSAGSSAFLDRALNLFYELRAAGVQKKPATAEFLDWMMALIDSNPDVENPLGGDSESVKRNVERTLSCLTKDTEAPKIAVKLIDRWLSENAPV